MYEVTAIYFDECGEILAKQLCFCPVFKQEIVYQKSGHVSSFGISEFESCVREMASIIGKTLYIDIGVILLGYCQVWSVWTLWSDWFICKAIINWLVYST